MANSRIISKLLKWYETGSPISHTCLERCAVKLKGSFLMYLRSMLQSPVCRYDILLCREAFTKPAGWTTSAGSTHYIGETKDGLERRFCEDLKLGLLHELSGATLSKFISLSRTNGLKKHECKLDMFMQRAKMSTSRLMCTLLSPHVVCCESATSRGCIYPFIG
jgi:hypothetical protein